VIVGSGRLIFNSKRRTLTVDANGEPPFIFKGSAEKTKKSDTFSTKSVYFI
jgi:hypothetical protein